MIVVKSDGFIFALEIVLERFLVLKLCCSLVNPRLKFIWSTVVLFGVILQDVFIFWIDFEKVSLKLLLSYWLSPLNF